MRFISSILALSFISSVAIAEAPSVKRGRLSVDPLLEEWFKQHEVDLGIEKPFNLIAITEARKGVQK